MSRLKQLLFSLKEADRKVIEEKLKTQDQQINQLKQQLAEKDKEINSLIVDYEKRIGQEQELMSNLEKQLAEKDKEIECLNKRIDRYENMFRSRINRTRDMQKDIELYINQLAITELEKVKAWCEENSDDLDDGETDERVCSAIGLDKPIITGDMALYDFIDQQIKELKGEKK